jgi:hypothetical protein
MPSTTRDDAGDVVRVDLFLEQAACRRAGEALSCSAELGLELGRLPYLSWLRRP